jgi:hypothetical protein
MSYHQPMTRPPLCQLLDSDESDEDEEDSPAEEEGEEDKEDHEGKDPSPSPPEEEPEEAEAVEAKRGEARSPPRSTKAKKGWSAGTAQQKDDTFTYFHQRPPSDWALDAWWSGKKHRSPGKASSKGQG